jgi:hypothetical protein
MQRAILGAGSATRSLRILLALGTWAALLLLVAMIVVVEERQSREAEYWGPVGVFLAVAFFALPALAAGYLGAAVLTARYRSLQVRRLRNALEQLPAERRSPVLLPLQSERNGDTRKLVTPLLRDLESLPPTELTPASPPGGRGDEPSPAG